MSLWQRVLRLRSYLQCSSGRGWRGAFSRQGARLARNREAHALLFGVEGGVIRAEEGHAQHENGALRRGRHGHEVRPAVDLGDYGSGQRAKDTLS